MNPRSSLLKRAAVPLLAVAATTLCAPTRAATASLIYSNYDVSSGTATERVKCSIYDDSTWKRAVFNAQLLVQGGGTLYTVDDQTLNYGGTGDYYAGTSAFGPTPLPKGNYNLWVICSGVDYYNKPWYASTGG